MLNLGKLCSLSINRGLIPTCPETKSFLFKGVFQTTSSGEKHGTSNPDCNISFSSNCLHNRLPLRREIKTLGLQLFFINSNKCSFSLLIPNSLFTQSIYCGLSGAVFPKVSTPLVSTTVTSPSSSTNLSLS